MGDPSSNASGNWGLSCLLVLPALLAVPAAVVIGIIGFVNSL